MLAHQKQQILDFFNAALAPLLAGTEVQATVTLERPRDPAHGDVACNIAMQLSRHLKKNPRELAQAIVAALMAQAAQGSLIEAAEIAGPGFINLRLSAAARQSVVKTVLTEAAQYGRSTIGALSCTVPKNSLGGTVTIV